MDFILDEDCPKSVGVILHNLGHQVFDIREIEPGASDEKIYERIQRESLILVTRDKGFGNILRFPVSRQYGIILLRVHRLPVPEIADLFRVFLDKIKLENLFGSLVVVQKGGYRIHRF